MRKRRWPQLNGSRGAALLVAGAYCLMRAFAYLPVSEGPERLPGGLRLIADALSIEAWAGAWLIVGITCVVKAFKRDDTFAWALLVGIMAGWGTAFLLGWINSVFIIGEPSREWLSAGTYLGPAVVIAILSTRRRGPRD